MVVGFKNEDPPKAVPNDDEENNGVDDADDVDDVNGDADDANPPNAGLLAPNKEPPKEADSDGNDVVVDPKAEPNEKDEEEPDEELVEEAVVLPKMLNPLLVLPKVDGKVDELLKVEGADEELLNMDGAGVLPPKEADAPNAGVVVGAEKDIAPGVDEKELKEDVCGAEEKLNAGVLVADA